MFSDMTKTLMLAVWQMLREVFQTLHDYNLAWGLEIHIRFNDFDSLSGSQVCRNQLKIIFGFLSTVL